MSLEDMIFGVRVFDLVWAFLNFWILIYMGVQHWVNMPERYFALAIALCVWSFAGSYELIEAIKQDAEVGFRSAFVIAANATTSWAIWKLRENRVDDAEL